MLDFLDRHLTHDCEGMSRRSFLTVGAATASGLTLSGFLAARQAQAAANLASGKVIKEPKAKSVIQLWMGGGPCHLDTFDPKPEAGEDYAGTYRKPLETNVKGIRINEKFEHMAKCADKFAIIRSMTHHTNGHETATYMMQTGTPPGGELVYPTYGAVVSMKKGQANDSNLPPYIMVPTPIGRISAAGFLGANYSPFSTGGDPNSKDFRVGGIVPPKGMTEGRMSQRQSLLEMVDDFARQFEDSPAIEAMSEHQKQAYGLILGDAKKAFDISEESDATRDRYGRNKFGQSCLLARRLVEHGVPFITVNSGGWDTHKKHFELMDEKLPPLDQAFAALLEDLSERGLLDSTVVVWGGEFGRRPKVSREPPWNGGRQHFCTCFNSVVAGGGFAGGQVVGASDRRGETVRDRPVYPWDLTSSIYQLLGIDPHGQLPHPHGCVAYVTPSSGGKVQSGGLLQEIM
jgi:hypothetical protein